MKPPHMVISASTPEQHEYLDKFAAMQEKVGYCADKHRYEGTADTSICMQWKDHDSPHGWEIAEERIDAFTAECNGGPGLEMTIGETA